MSKWEILIPILKDNLARLCAASKAGRISHYFTAQTTVASDKEILTDVTGMKIELSEAPSQCSNKYAQTAFSSAETNITDSEIAKMLNKGIIEKATHESN